MNPTAEQVAQWAREAFEEASANGGNVHECSDIFNQRLAILACAWQAEQDAKLCDVTPPYPFRPSIEAAHAIRANAPKVTT